MAPTSDRLGGNVLPSTAFDRSVLYLAAGSALLLVLLSLAASTRPARPSNSADTTQRSPVELEAAPAAAIDIAGEPGTTDPVAPTSR
jgi:hypothetical protein